MTLPFFHSAFSTKAVKNKVLAIAAKTDRVRRGSQK
jgi:hypothetical protein